jgi:hypothetical protein
MMMNKAAISAIGALLTATLACSIFVGGPSYPAEAIPSSTATAQSLEDQVQQALTSAADSGLVSVQVTEDQLTSYLQTKLAEQPEPLITEPRVVLQDGEVAIYGKARSGIFTANISLSMQVTVDENGEAQIRVTKTDFGPMAVPQGLNDALTALVREALTGSLGPVATGFRLEKVEIGDGIMTVTGRIK